MKLEFTIDIKTNTKKFKYSAYTEDINAIAKEFTDFIRLIEDNYKISIGEKNRNQLAGTVQRIVETDNPVSSFKNAIYVSVRDNTVVRVRYRKVDLV